MPAVRTRLLRARCRRQAVRHAENLIRKDFTPSERFAIANSMAARLGERRGGDRRSEEFQTANNCGLIEEKRDLAAEHAGFGNGA
jgi:ParB family chromosome partitioning protein